MKKGKSGFTLVEVAIFLAITGVLFIGITAGVQNSIYQQRRNDAVQSFVEFLRGVYSGVENVQNDAQQGRSEQAIYGKMVTFGEELNLAGQKNDGKIFAYTVVGDIKDTTKSDALEVLADLGAEVFGRGQSQLAGYPEEFIPKWGSTIEDTGSSGTGTPRSGTLLIVRHPSSGTVYTFFSKDTVQVNEAINEKNGYNDKNNRPLANLAMLGFDHTVDVDFCVNPDGMSGATDRTNIRIKANARNASSIERVPDYDGKCGAKW